MEKTFKGTLGEWQINNDVSWPEITSNGKPVCIIAHHKDDSSEVIMSNQKLIAASPLLLEALQVAKDTICSLKLSILAHPDCTDGSEFDDYTSTAQEVEDQIEEAINKALD